MVEDTNIDETHERLEESIGYAHVEQLAENEEDDVWRVRVVPIGEGDITHGQSGEPTIWEREPLEAAVENGVFDGAKLLKGRPDDGHKDMLSQADPDEIIGGVEEWSYEPGVGPVGEGKVLDEHLAKLIEHDLVDVSPDMFRLLGEYDNERDVNTVDEIIDVPYITVLDHGAAESNSIEPQMAEALGVNQSERAELQEQLSTLKAKQNRLKERKGDLEEQLAAKETAIEEQKQRIEQLRSEFDALKEEAEPLRELLAGLVADESMLNSEQVAQRFNITEMVEALAENSDAAGQVSSVDCVREQLAESFDGSGNGAGKGALVGQLSADEEEHANQMAREIMGAKDVLTASEEQLSPREYASEHLGADPAAYDSLDDFRDAVRDGDS